MASVRFAYVVTPLGQLHYAEAGRGPVVLLLHQTPRSHDEFRELQPLLAENHRVLALDMPGFGQSPPLPAPQSIEVIAAGVVGFLDALGIADVVLLGHHTGGVVGVEIAATRPERVRGLVLSSTPYAGPEYREAHAHGTAVDDVRRAGDGSHLVELWKIRQPYYPPDRPDLLERFVRDALAPGVDPAEGHRACGRYVMEDKLGDITAPVLLVGADSDPFVFPAIPEFRKRLTRAERCEVAVVAGGMVPLMEQKPAEVAAAVLAFLAPAA